MSSTSANPLSICKSSWSPVAVKLLPVWWYRYSTPNRSPLSPVWLVDVEDVISKDRLAQLVTRLCRRELKVLRVSEVGCCVAAAARAKFHLQMPSWMYAWKLTAPAELPCTSLAR